jgi:hypothetical protein
MKKHPILRAAEKRAQRRKTALGALPPPEKVSKAVSAACERAVRRSEKLCACCGALTAPLAQFWNQDTGYGLCSSCAVWIENRQGPEYLAATYGKRGIHIESKEMLNG